MQNKRGQFFLIAALIIIAILVGFGTTYNYVKTQKEDKSSYDLSEEIDEEASFVVDQGVFYAKSTSQIEENIQNLTNFYAALNPTSNIIIAYGDQNFLNIYYYNNTETGEVGISSGGDKVKLTIKSRNFQNGSIQNPEETVIVQLSPDNHYNFTLTQGQNFYLVIIKDREDETIVAEQK